MRLHFWWAFALLLSIQADAAVFSGKARGTTAVPLLKLPASARAIAMGEAYTAVADDAYSVFWNPAGLNKMKTNHSAQFMHALYVDNINFGFAGYAQRLGALGAAGVGVQYMDLGDIKRTDDAGNELGVFSPQDTIVSASWARKIWIFPFGVTGKYVSSEIVNKASTYAMDLGLAYPGRLMDGRLKLSAAARNIGPGIKFRTERSPLPFEFKIGSSYNLLSYSDSESETDKLLADESLLISADLSFPIDNDPVGAVGVEGWRLLGNLPFYTRVGLNTRTIGDISGISGISFGAGSVYKSMNLDYALTGMGDLGVTHRISIGWNF